MFPDKFDRYIEVFGGAGWVFFYKDKVKGQLEVFNDINDDLINVYRCIQNHCEELQRQLDFMPQSRTQYFDYHDQMHTKGLTDIQRAARYLYILRHSFGGDRRTFATRPRNLTKTIERLPEISERLDGVVLEHNDFERIIKVYDSPGTLFYLDPPYYGSEKLYDYGFKWESHVRLRECLDSIKGKFILSYNDDPKIRQLYQDYNITSVSRAASLAAKPKSKVYEEVIIRNF